MLTEFSITLEPSLTSAAAAVDAWRWTVHQWGRAKTRELQTSIQLDTSVATAAAASPPRRIHPFGCQMHLDRLSGVSRNAGEAPAGRAMVQASGMGDLAKKLAAFDILKLVS